MDATQWGGRCPGAGRPGKPKLTLKDCTEVLELLGALEGHLDGRLIPDAVKLKERSKTTRARVIALKDSLDSDAHARHEDSR